MKKIKLFMTVFFVCISAFFFTSSAIGTITIKYEASFSKKCLEPGKGCSITIVLTPDEGGKLIFNSDRHSFEDVEFPELYFSEEETERDFGIYIPKQIGVWNDELGGYLLEYVKK